MSDELRRARTIATFFVVGRIKGPAGTWASLAALPCAWVIEGIGGVFALALATGAAIVLGLWASGVLLAREEDPDPGWIVIDEVAGQWLALLIAHLFGVHWDLIAFALFRTFDIAKPGPVGWAEKNFPGAAGVMADDLVAGALAGIALVIVRVLAW